MKEIAKVEDEVELAVAIEHFGTNLRRLGQTVRANPFAWSCQGLQ
ncbi:hypothetical protein [Acidithrix ferrooxidans]|nr:hypothetical protein [Acidithrix ferrooxidans]CAG4901088.1 unnamed protein product [Acidithrix sp. C25]